MKDPQEKYSIKEMDSQLSSFLSMSGRNSGGIYKLSLNLLNLDKSDFPDVCMHCDLCM